VTDTCPACQRPAVEPSAARRRGDRVVHGYQCPRCRHTWTTTRDLTAYRRHLHAVPPAA
jgi:transposase-like protein